MTDVGKHPFSERTQAGSGNTRDQTAGNARALGMHDTGSGREANKGRGKSDHDQAMQPRYGLGIFGEKHQGHNAKEDQQHPKPDELVKKYGYRQPFIARMRALGGESDSFGHVTRDHSRNYA